MSAVYRCEEMTRSHSLSINIYSSLKKRSTRVIGNALYMSAMTPIVLHLCVLICIFKRKRGRRKDEGKTESHFHVFKYYLRIGDGGFLFGENNFDL